MSKRREDSTSESLAEALSRVMVTRQDADHRENFDWATNEGRGDRMPRFLERAIEDVPHAARIAGPRATYQGRTYRPFGRTTLLLSVVAIATGVAVSVASPSALAPLWSKLHQASADLGDQGWDGAWAALSWADASWASLSFTSSANAATPRLGFGEVLRNYSEQAAIQAARGHIIVSDLAPGTTLSAGTPVSDTSWSLPQSDLDGVVITFPTGVAAAAMRATVEIPGNTAASSGKFRLEMRQADDPVEGEPSGSAAAQPDAGAPVATSNEAPSGAESTAAAAGAGDAAKEAEAAKDVVKARGEPARTIKRSKPRPQASVTKPATVAAAAATAAKVVKPTATANADTADTGPSLSNLLPSWSSPTWKSGPTPNALMMFSLGGPTAD